MLKQPNVYVTDFVFFWIERKNNNPIYVFQTFSSKLNSRGVKIKYPYNYNLSKQTK